MRDDTYALPLLPESMTGLTVDGANAIEENLRYLISLFPLFDAALRASAIGSLGYLELAETGAAGEGFAVDTAVRIDRLAVLVEGAPLSALSWSGENWRAESAGETALLLVRTTGGGYWDAAGVTAALSALRFRAAADLDAALTLTAACDTVLSFDPLGPVSLRFRSSAVWALIEAQGWTWEGIENAALAWTELQALRKEYYQEGR